MCGTVARKPKFTPELATRMLFGPGVNPMEVRNGKLAMMRVQENGCMNGG
jgi:hypothetical protein